MTDKQPKLHIALTGHRPKLLGGYNMSAPGYVKLQNDLKRYIQFQLDHYETVWCHSGLALGADTVWSKAILDAKQQYPERVFFHAEIPTLSQKDAWFKKSDIDFWDLQVSRADEKTVYDPEFETYNETKRKRLIGKVLNDRNIGMINHADILLAVYVEGSTGGTKNAIDYAKSQNKAIQYIDPTNYF